MDTCELLSFTLAVKLDTGKLYYFTPIWMMFTFTQCQNVMGKLEFVQSFCFNVAWSYPNVGDG